uniref:DUF2815 family protein n=1 Tax=Salmonella phage pJS4 TaxID=3141578 RepID=A0AAU7E322_9VIRU
MGIKLNLKNVRIGWVNVFEKAADSVNANGQPVKGKFQLTAYLDKNDPQISKLDATVLEVLTEGMKSAKAAEKWMDKNYGFGNHADKCAIRDLAERDKPIEGLEEGLYFKATSQKRPVIMTSAGERQGSERGLTIDGDDIEGKEVYAGCYANISVEIYWYDAYKTLLVNLLGVRFREDGEAFGGAGEVATDDDLDDDDDKPSKPKRRPSRDEDGEEEERPRRKRRSYEDDEE